MRDLARHKLLLALATSIVKKSSERGIMMPSQHHDALEDENIINMDVQDEEIPASLYLKETLGECLECISEKDYLVLRKYVHSMQHDSIDLKSADNIAFSGGGGKGIGYSGLIKYLSEETNYAYSPASIREFLVEKLDVQSIPQESPIFINNKMGNREFSKALANIFEGNKLQAANALYLMAHEGLIKEQPVIETIKAVSGTSAGAITALPVALGMNYEDYSKLLINSQFNHFFMDSSSLLTSAARLFSPDLYRNKYINKYSALYVDKLTQKIGEIIPEVCSDSSMDEKRALVESLLNSPTPFGIDYLHQRVKKSGYLDKIKEEVDEELDGVISNHASNPVRKFLSKLPIPNRLINTMTRSKQDFDAAGGFKSSRDSYGYKSPNDEAFFVSIYRQSKTDNISMFFGRLISNRLKEIDIDKLKRVLPAKAEDAFSVSPDTAFNVISLAKDYLNQTGGELSDENIYTTCYKMCSLTRHDLHANWLDSDICMENTLRDLGMPIIRVTEGERQILDNAMTIIEAAYREKSGRPELSELAEDQVAQTSIMRRKNLQRACERTFYNDLSSINFKELKDIQTAVPEMGIKDIHISATGSRLTHLKLPRTIYFSHKENPNTPIQKAIRASMTIPLLFNKTREGKFNLYDGGVYENTPITPFKRERSTIVAMAEDQDFFERANTPIKSWRNRKYHVFPPVMTWLNTHIRKFSLSESMRTVFGSSYHHGTVDFSFRENTLEKVSQSNLNTLSGESGFTRDAMYYFLRNKHEVHGDDNAHQKVNAELEKGLYKGVFSKRTVFGDRYGKDMVKFAKDYKDQSYDI